MGPLEAMKQGIDEFKKMSGAKEADIVIVMAPNLKEQLIEYVKKTTPVMKDIPNEKMNRVYGVEIITKEAVPDGGFGIYHRDCLDHIDEHVKEFAEMDYDVEYEVEGPDIPDGVEWIQCDLCEHPLSIEMAVGDDIKCPWCGDVNDLEDLFGDGDE